MESFLWTGQVQGWRGYEGRRKLDKNEVQNETGNTGAEKLSRVQGCRRYDRGGQRALEGRLEYLVEVVRTSQHLVEVLDVLGVLISSARALAPLFVPLS